MKAMLQEFKEQRLIHRRFAFQILLEVGSLSGGRPSNNRDRRRQVSTGERDGRFVRVQQ